MLSIAYVISEESDDFAWFAVNQGEEFLVGTAINLHFDDDVDIEYMTPKEASERTDDVPTSVARGSVEKFNYGS